MPNRDGTGPIGQGMGRGRRMSASQMGGAKECTCPKCGYKETQVRGIPCTEKMCPKCNTPMKGVTCA